MIAVAVAALAMEGWIVWGRYTTSRARATMLAAHIRGLRRQVAAAKTPTSLIRGLVIEYPSGREVRPNAETLAAFGDYLETLAHKAERDARRPWLPTPPDPPYPD